MDDACSWMATFVDWYNHQHCHSGIRLVQLSQRHNGEAMANNRHRAYVYEEVRLTPPRRWSRKTRYWRHPQEVWINPLTTERDDTRIAFMMATCSLARAKSSLVVTTQGSTITPRSYSQESRLAHRGFA